MKSRLIHEAVHDLTLPVDKSWWGVLTEARDQSLRQHANLNCKPIGTYPDGLLALSLLQTGDEQDEFALMMVRLQPLRPRDKVGSLAVGRLVEVMTAGYRGGAVSDGVYASAEVRLELAGIELVPTESAALYQDHRPPEQRGRLVLPEPRLAV
jgi:hypothetical protein